MKTILIFSFLFCELAHGSPVENSFDQRPIYKEKHTFPALYQGSRFLKWDGDEVSTLSKAALQNLAVDRVNTIYRAFGYKAGE